MYPTCDSTMIRTCSSKTVCCNRNVCSACEDRYLNQRRRNTITILEEMHLKRALTAHTSWQKHRHRLTYTQSHSHTQIRAHTYTQTHTHRHAHTPTHPPTHTHTHARTHARKHTQSQNTQNLCNPKQRRPKRRGARRRSNNASTPKTRTRH